MNVTELRKFLMCFTMTLFLVSCTTAYQPPPVAQASVSDPTKNTSPQTPKPIKDPKPKTISEAIKACRMLQDMKKMPFSCGTEYLNGIPTMAVGFPDDNSLKEWLPAFSEIVGNPFCESASQTNRQALILVVIHSIKMANLYSCETKSLSGWFSLDDIRKQKKKGK